MVSKLSAEEAYIALRCDVISLTKWAIGIDGNKHKGGKLESVNDEGRLWDFFSFQNKTEMNFNMLDCTFLDSLVWVSYVVKWNNV